MANSGTFVDLGQESTILDYITQQQVKRERGRDNCSALVASLDAGQRNALKLLLLSRHGQDDLRKALGIQPVAECGHCPKAEAERYEMLGRTGRTAELFKKEDQQ